MAPPPTTAHGKDPVGRPVRCIRDWNYSFVPGSNPSAVLKKGEVGRIKDHNPKTKQYQIHFPRRDQQGRSDAYVVVGIDDRYIEVNWLVKWGDIRIETNIVPTGSGAHWHNNVKFKSDEHNLTKLSYHLIYSILEEEKAGRLEWLGPWIKEKFRSPDQLLEWCRETTRAAKAAGTADGFDEKNGWTFQDFWNKGQQIDKRTGGSGIYLGLFQNHPNSQVLESPMYYVGKTEQNFGERYKRHDAATKNPGDDEYNNYKYRLARQTNRRYIKLLQFSSSSLRDYDLREQLMMCLFNTYRADVRTAKPTANSPDQTAKEIEATMSAREPAAQLYHIYSDLWSKLGWSKPIRGIRQGLNKLTPIDIAASDKTKLLWVHQDAGDRDTYTRTTSRVKISSLNPDGNQRKILLQFCLQGVKGATQNKNLSFTAMADDESTPAVGVSVTATIEIMKVGPHPQSYGRLPPIGWSNADQVGQLAIRLDWYDPFKGGHRQVYLQMTLDQATRTISKDEPRALVPWANATALRMYVEGTSFSQNPSWWRHFGQARVCTLQFDAFEQQFVIKDRKSSLQSIPFPQVDDRAVKTFLIGKGFDNYGRDRDANDGLNLNVKPQGMRRKTCDTCYPQWGGVPKCERSPLGTGECKLCYVFGRKCTFTHSGKLESKAKQGILDGMLALLWFKPNDPASALVEDPMMVQGTWDE